MSQPSPAHPVPRLRPCPFLSSHGGSKAELRILGGTHMGFWVSCEVCEARGPISCTESVAADAWNERRLESALRAGEHPYQGQPLPDLAKLKAADEAFERGESVTLAEFREELKRRQPAPSPGLRAAADRIVGSPEHVALWDAINRHGDAVGSYGPVSVQVQRTVVAVESALAGLLSAHWPAPAPAADTSRMFRMQDGPAVPWALGVAIYEHLYAPRYGREQSAERISERGGFSWGEVDMLWKDRRHTTDAQRSACNAWPAEPRGRAAT